MPPPRGQWARPGTVDGPIGRFLLPLRGGSAEVARNFYFLIREFMTNNLPIFT